MNRSVHYAAVFPRQLTTVSYTMYAGYIIRTKGTSVLIATCNSYEQLPASVSVWNALATNSEIIISK